jgi:hypothetical protein
MPTGRMHTLRKRKKTEKNKKRGVTKMNEKYFAVPKVIFSISDRMIFSDKDIGMIVEALYNYFVGKETLETVTDGMSMALSDVTTCLICMEEEDYESF